MVQRRTPTGARRSGDDYQDLVAASVLLRVLKYPSRYRWAKFEAREAGRLDDILVLRADGTIEALQVKYSTDALGHEDPWTWEKLLVQRGRRKRSLIQDWWKSVAQLDETYGATEPRLVSNRRAGDNLLLTPTGRVDRSRTDPALLAQIQQQLGGGSDAFLNRFRFDVDRPDLGDLAESTRREFQALRLPEEDWPRFMEAIRSWIRGEGLSETGEIQVEHIRSACGWRQLSSLSQHFEIPDDFTLPNPRFHDDFMERVDQGSGSVIVLTAEPGAGKSTYLSQLVETLHGLERPVIRHHYSLGNNGDRLERVASNRVAESLMKDINDELGPYLGELASQNPEPDKLDARLRQVGSQLQSEGRRLVVVIDGLDHVWREIESREELIRLFDQLLPVPQGVVLVVGTQPVEDVQLPPSLLRLVPRGRWITLPRLDRSAISKWLNHHHDLMPPEWVQNHHDWHRSQLADSLYSRTGGHPLLNRYIVERIKGEGKHLTTDSIEEIPETPADSVEGYYRALWVSLTPEARDVVFLLAVAQFPWPEGGLFECLRFAGYEQASSAAGVTAVSHLLGRDEVGIWPFHSSILLFARQEEEFAARAPALRAATIKWLEEEAPDYWRRSHLWLLHLDAGNAKPLLEGSDRRWVLEAVASGHPLDEVASVLQEAAWAAIDRADYPTYVDRGVLADAVERATHLDEALRWLFDAQLALVTDDYLEGRAIAGITELEAPHLLVLALHLHNQDRCDQAKACFAEIKRRLEREVGNGHQTEGLRQRVEVFAELAGLVGIDPGELTNFIARFPAEAAKVTVAERWVAGLRHSGDVLSALRVLDEPVSASVQRCVSRHIAIVAADEGIHLSGGERQLLAPPYAWVYLVFQKGQLDAEPPEEPPPPPTGTRSEYGEYAQLVGRYVHDLFFFLVIRELQTPGFCSGWVPPTSFQTWFASSLEAVAQGASAVAAGWREAQSLLVTPLYDATMSFKNPPWRDGTVARESATGVRRALRTITEDLLLLRHATGGSAKLRWEEVQVIAAHNLAGYAQVLEWIADGTVDIEREAIHDLCTSLDGELASRVEPFGERAKTFSCLATVCARYGFPRRARCYLRRASENLVAYSERKDMLLHIALEAIEAGAQHFESREQFWLKLAPSVASVLQFTDGDETSHLAARLGSLLLRLDPRLATVYMKSLMDAEQYGDVEKVLRDLVETGDLTDPVVRALVSTCVEPDPIRILEERASGSDPLAEAILEISPGFSANFAEENSAPPASSDPEADSARTTPDSVGPIHYAEFPPERLDELVRSDALAWPANIADELCSWLCHWAATERAADAVEAVKPYLLADGPVRVSNQAVAVVRRTVGRSQSYAWLVQAQRSNNGWLEYYSRSEETKERWCSVKHDFPDSWHDFLAKSIRLPRGLPPLFGMTIARLVEYLLYFERRDDAYAVTCQLVETIGDLVSAQELPIPPWINPTAEGL